MLADPDEPPWPGGTGATLESFGYRVEWDVCDVGARPPSQEERELFGLPPDQRVDDRGGDGITLLAVLLAHDLVSRTGNARDGRYIAASPTIALGPLVRQRREELRRAELELGALSSGEKSAWSNGYPSSS